MRRPRSPPPGRARSSPRLAPQRLNRDNRRSLAVRTPHRMLLLAAGLGALLCSVPGLSAAEHPPQLLCTVPDSANALPPSTRHGPLARLHPYPAVWLATPAQRATARRILETVRKNAREWRDPKRARALGFDTKHPSRTAANRSEVLVFHAERSASRKDGRAFDPARPKALVFADYPGGRLRLLGLLYGMRRGLKGETPGGPITRWHTHATCGRGTQRGTKPRPDGSCPPGLHLRQGNEMMHIWLTHDVRSAFSLHAPYKELCALHMLRGRTWCARPSR